jgi:arginyl-tRNA synthetase
MEVDYISMVSVLDNGEAFKMSKRAGTSVRIREILEEMHRDIFRYSLITKGKEQNMEIDIALITKEDANNPYYYTQYANARVNQILEKATDVATTENFDKLAVEEKERELMSKMIEFEDVIITMEKEREPSLIVNYQKELTQAFNSYYAVCKVITEDNELSAQRVMLMKAVKNLFGTIFNLLNIEPIKKL